MTDYVPIAVAVFSFEGKPNQVSLIYPDDEPTQTFSLIKNQEQWKAALKGVQSQKMAQICIIGPSIG